MSEPAKIITAGILMAIAIVLIAHGCAPPNESQPAQSTASVPFPPGEYVTTANETAAAVSADHYVLAIKALDRKDIPSIRRLYDEGLLFRLPKETRLALLPAEVEGTHLPTSVLDTVDGVSICSAIVESGDRIGTKLTVACNGLNPSY
jgi:hypothetical protein